jgi:hypothetical protein
MNPAPEYSRSGIYYPCQEWTPQPIRLSWLNRDDLSHLKAMIGKQTESALGKFANPCHEPEITILGQTLLAKRQLS